MATSSKLAGQCSDAPNSLADTFKITLHRVLGHRNIVVKQDTNGVATQSSALDNPSLSTFYVLLSTIESGIYSQCSSAADRDGNTYHLRQIKVNVTLLQQRPITRAGAQTHIKRKTHQHLQSIIKQVCELMRTNNIWLRLQFSKGTGGATSDELSLA